MVVCENCGCALIFLMRNVLNLFLSWQCFYWLIPTELVLDVLQRHLWSYAVVCQVGAVVRKRFSRCLVILTQQFMVGWLL